jgi:predicted DNA-binding antitoxin AbrB/MazE fold protein
MTQQIEAVYENGILRPSQTLGLAEHERVRITITSDDRDDLLDEEFGTEQVLSGVPSLEDVRLALSSIQGSMDDAINELRGEY